MFDFSSLSVNTVADSKLSVSQIQQNLKDIAFETVFGDNTDKLIQVDTHKYVMPIDYNGMIHYVEIDFVAKKDDFDAQTAEHNYQVKLQKNIEKELTEKTKVKKTDKDKE